jgi:uncharacterized protein
LEKLKNNTLTATVFVEGKPILDMERFGDDGRFHLLSLPFDSRLEDLYFPAQFETSDYPNLVAPGQPVDTSAVGTILAVYNWPNASDRYRKVGRFVDAFFSHFDQFWTAPNHPKWQEVNLTAMVPNWVRFIPAQE